MLGLAWEGVLADSNKTLALRYRGPFTNYYYYYFILLNSITKISRKNKYVPKRLTTNARLLQPWNEARRKVHMSCVRPLKRISWGLRIWGKIRKRTVEFLNL